MVKVKHKYHTWTQDEEEELKALFMVKTYRELSDIFKVTKSSIGHKARKLGLHKVHDYRRDKVRNVVCENCGRSFDRPQSTIFSGSRNFCSWECYNIWRGKNAYVYPVDLTPTTNLAYLAGVLMGDGSCGKYSQGQKSSSRFTYTVSLEVIERAFADSFSRALGKIGLKPFTFQAKKTGNRKNTWVVEGRSKMLYQWWKKQSLNSIENLFFEKDNFFKEFLRGFYESEGTINKWELGLSNTNKELLTKIQRKLHQLSFKSSLRGSYERRGDRKPSYQLYILGGKQERSRFLEMIKPSIKREGGGMDSEMHAA